MTNVEWSGGAVLDEQTVSDAETQLGVTFPQDFRLIVSGYDGAQPKPNRFRYWDPNLGSEVGDSIGPLLSLRTDRAENLFVVLTWLSDQLPENVIPIADDGGGNFLSLDYRGGSEPRVVFWDHERDGEDAVIPLAASFSAFLAMLHQ